LCRRCGAQNQPDEDFCGECAAPLAQTPGTPANKPNEAPIRIVEAPDAGSFDGERKTVTALFADIKGSMELMEDLDPEEARAIVDPALKLMMDAVRRYDGYIVQPTGDGIFALFGAPVAHEDHPQRALYAALRIQDQIRHYADNLRAEGRAPLPVRIGINAGEVVVRSIRIAEAKSEYTPIGHTANLAARMQTLANPGSIVIAENTQRLVEGYFTVRPLGASRVKGLADAINLYEVTGLGPLRTRLQRAALRGLTKFVGRQREMDALKHAAEQAQAGHGQIVAVMADPGVGKSRLFYEFKAIAQSGWMVLEAFSVSHGKASAYLPVLELLAAYYEFSRDDDERKRRERILGKVLGLDRNLEDTLPCLYSLHGITEAGDSLAQMDPQIRRRRTIEAIKRVLLRESINQPLMIIFEDLHWIDPETQALLNLVVDSITNARILLLVNYRPEYRHEWGSRTHYTQLRLDPLPRENAEEMLSALLGDDEELAALKRLIIARTDGTPFFMEEMVQALFEEGVLQRNGTLTLAQPISAIKVPPTVQAVLASRIDRLAPADKELLQTLAVLGREFSLSLVQSVSSRSSDELEQTLSHLQLSEFINEQPAVGDIEYSFKHALTQQVAYNSLLTERRRALHGRAARVLEGLYVEHIEDHYGALAHHYLLSDDTSKAIKYAQLAAAQAVNRGAYGEATGVIEAAVKLLDKLPRDAECVRAELALRNIESLVARVSYGMGSPEFESVVRRTCELGEEIGEKKQARGPLLAFISFARGEPAHGLQLIRQSLELAEVTGDAKQLAVAHMAAGTMGISSGDFGEAVSHLGEALRYARRADLRFTPFGLLYDCVVQNDLAIGLQLQGHLNQADELFDRALRQSRDSRHLFSLAFVLSAGGSGVNHHRRQPERVRVYSEEAVALSDENGFIEWLDQACFYHGWAVAELGEADKGIAEMEAALSRRTLIYTIWPQYFIALLARCYAKVGRVREALAMLKDPLLRIEETGEKGAKGRDIEDQR
jgi:class 3 adenylate cyclase